ncbi:MAG: hypothetical protein AVDCRST_MAG28-3216, partial [uncultured Rubrobacteraceae bacterium]
WCGRTREWPEQRSSCWAVRGYWPAASPCFVGRP